MSPANQHKEAAGERALIILLTVGAVVCAFGILTACVVAPLNGHWEPDLGLSFWVIIAGIWLAIRCLLRWRAQ